MAMDPNAIVRKGAVKQAGPGKQNKKGNLFKLKSGAGKGKMGNVARM